MCEKNKMHGEKLGGYNVDMDNIDYSKDKFQGCNHYGITSYSSSPDKDCGVPKTEREFYSVARNPNQAMSDSVAMCKCLSCGESDIKALSNYCPNCGKKFI